MSYDTWHNYGYGICVDDITEQDVGKLEQLLDCAPVFHAKVQKWLSDSGVADPT